MEQLLLERFALSLCSNKLGLEADTACQTTSCSSQFNNPQLLYVSEGCSMFDLFFIIILNQFV